MAERVAEYKVLRTPPGSNVVVIVSGAACTVNVVLPLTPLAVAEIVLVPALEPVASPALLMVATLVLVEAHATCPVMFCVLPSV